MALELTILFFSGSAARVHKRGVIRLQLDDWLTINCILWYTLLIVSLNKVFFGGGSNFMTAAEEAALTPETTADRVAGSKWVLVSEEAMVLTVWTCKLGMLFLYRRITYVYPTCISFWPYNNPPWLLKRDTPTGWYILTDLV